MSANTQYSSFSKSGILVELISSLLSNVDTNNNCTFFRIGWMFNPINDSNEKDIADTKKESINKKNTESKKKETPGSKIPYDIQLGDLKDECAFSLVKQIKGIVGTKEYDVKNTDALRTRRQMIKRRGNTINSEMGENR